MSFTVFQTSCLCHCVPLLLAMIACLCCRCCINKVELNWTVEQPNHWDSIRLMKVILSCPSVVHLHFWIENCNLLKLHFSNQTISTWFAVFFSLRRCRVVSLLCGPWSLLLSLPANKREPRTSVALADLTLQSGSNDSFKTQELRSSLLLLLAWIQLLSFSHFNRTPFLFDTQQHRVVKCERHTGDKGAWNPSWPASFPLLWLQQPSLGARPLGGIHRSHLATKMDPFIYTETWSGLIPGSLCWTPALSLSWEASLSRGACGSGCGS